MFQNNFRYIILLINKRKKTFRELLNTCQLSGKRTMTFCLVRNILSFEEHGKLLIATV